MWPLSTEPRPVRGSEPTSDPRTALAGVVGCRFRPQGASAVGVHKASLTPPQNTLRPKELAYMYCTYIAGSACTYISSLSPRAGDLLQVVWVECMDFPRLATFVTKAKP